MVHIRSAGFVKTIAKCRSVDSRIGNNSYRIESDCPVNQVTVVGKAHCLAKSINVVQTTVVTAERAQINHTVARRGCEQEPMQLAADHALPDNLALVVDRMAGSKSEAR